MYTTPLAYFITFHTYGTWFHGDSRGSVDPGHNSYGKVLLPPDPPRAAREQSRLSRSAVVLDDEHRRSVERTIREVCAHNGWKLLAVHVRTNHVHVVVTAEKPPEIVMNTLKSWATRRLAEQGLIERGQSMWTRHGSTRYLWKEVEVSGAVHYVLHEQGAELR